MEYHSRRPDGQQDFSNWFGKGGYEMTGPWGKAVVPNITSHPTKGSAAGVIPKLSARWPMASRVMVVRSSSRWRARSISANGPDWYRCHGCLVKNSSGPGI